MDLGSARHWARDLHARWALPGAICVDATMGNGGDTEALCALVGPQGHVYAFDVQPGALEHTRARLDQQGLTARATLLLTGHEHLADCVPGPVDLVVFNLGWLPGSADKRVTTRTQTTLVALQAALTLLRPDGLITVCAYPGHGEGARELDAVRDWAASLPADCAQSMVTRYVNQADRAPVLIAVMKHATSGSNRVKNL